MAAAVPGVKAIPLWKAWCEEGACGQEGGLVTRGVDAGRVRWGEVAEDQQSVRRIPGTDHPPAALADNVFWFPKEGALYSSCVFSVPPLAVTPTVWSAFLLAAAALQKAALPVFSSVGHLWSCCQFIPAAVGTPASWSLPSADFGDHLLPLLK